jgi:transcriptional regulator with XRE-family HTH domain
VAFSESGVIMQRIMRPQDTTRAWLRFVMEQLNARRRADEPLSIRQLAIGSKVDPSTLSRFLNNEEVEHDLSRATVSKIEHYTGIKFGAHTDGRAPLIAREPEASAYNLDVKGNDKRIDEAVRYMLQSQPGLDPWVLKTRALELAGYLPGDVVLVDLNAEPEDGDAVVAQHYDLQTETIFRLYQKPYLVAAAVDRVPRAPLVVDDRRVLIRGVVIGMFRQRKGHLAAA